MVAARRPGRPARVQETRQADTRANDRRPMPKSQHVGKLYVPQDEIPAGWTYSWIDVGAEQPNVQRAGEQAQKGWSPVPRSRHPQFSRGGSLIPGFAESDPYAQYIKIGGSLLCERPTDEVEADKQHVRDLTSSKLKSISRWRNGEGADPLMPRVDDSELKYGHAAAFKKD